MSNSTSSNRRLEGKVAVITGGASGIGEATARYFIEQGARAVVIADVQDEMGQNVASSLDRCIYIHCDIVDEDQVKSLVDSTVSRFGRLDIMFSNAGVITSSSMQTVLELDLASYDRINAVNARGMAACVKHAARVMVDGSVKGSIVCTGSVAAAVGSEIGTDYTMTKHAVLGLVKCASMQLASHGIRVNCVSPGAVKTPMFIGFVGEEIAESKGVLRGRNIADAVVFLASDDAEFVTGANLVVDGGFR